MAVAEPECGRAVKYMIDQPVKAYDRPFTHQLLDQVCFVPLSMDQPVELTDNFSRLRPHSGSATAILGFNLQIRVNST